MSYFSSALVRLRKQDGLTQAELADALGMSKSTISMYESGKRKPSFEVSEMLADYFNVNMDQLYGRDDPSEEENEPAVIDGKPLDAYDLKLLRMLRTMSQEDKDWLLEKIDAILSLR